MRTPSKTGPGLRGAAVRLAVALWTVALGASAMAQTTVEHVLDNGMKVLVREDHRAPTAVHLVLYRAGSIDEVSGTTGIAHVLEHMMFKGTEQLAPGEFSRRVAALGGSENAFTSRDYSGYFQQVPSAKLPDVMALEAQRMSQLVLDAEEFAREVRVVLEERRLRTEDSPGGLLYENFVATAYKVSPYRHPVIGWRSDLEALTLDDARHWYRSWYAPNNAVLLVVGDVDAQQVIEDAKRTYGKVASRPLPARRPVSEPEQIGQRRVEVKAPAEEPMLLMGWHVPGLKDVDADVDPYALEMLASVLDGGETARLTRRLVREQRIANSAGAGYSLAQRGPALFTLEGVPAAGHDIAALERALLGEIRRIAEEGVEPRELERMKTQYVASRIYARDSLFAQAREMGSLEMVGLSHGDADRIIERIRAVSPEDVKRVAATYFSEDTLTVATLAPQPLDGKPRRAPPPGARH